MQDLIEWQPLKSEKPTEWAKPLELVEKGKVAYFVYISGKKFECVATLILFC